MKQARPAVVCLVTLIRREEKPMKPLVSGSVLGAVAGAAMLLSLAAIPAAAQMPGGSYLQSCRDVQMRGDRLVATCRTEEGRWNQTSISNIDRCAGGVSNYDGRLVCGTHGGGFNMGNTGDRDRRGDDRRGDDRRGDDRREDGRRGDRDRQDSGWRRDRDWNGYGSPYGPPYGPYGPGPGRDPWGRW
jgi:hypothetical protein